MQSFNKTYKPLGHSCGLNFFLIISFEKRNTNYCFLAIPSIILTMSMLDTLIGLIIPLRVVLTVSITLRTISFLVSKMLSTNSLCRYQ